MNNELWIGPGQTAQLLNYSDNYIRHHEQQLGLKPQYTGGGHRRYPLDEVLRIKSRIEEERKKSRLKRGSFRN